MNAPSMTVPANGIPLPGDQTVARIGKFKFAIPDFSMWDWYTFLLSFTCCITFKAGGTLFGSDIVLVLGLPVLLTTRFQALFYKPVRRLIFLGGLWLVAQMVTDYVRKSAPADYERGWLKIVFTVALFCVVWILVHNSQRRCVLYAVGLALGTAVRSLSFKNDFVTNDPWKFGYAFPASILVLLLVAFLMRKTYSVYYQIPVVVLALLNIAEGFRSQAFILMLVVVVTHGYKSMRVRGKTLSKTKLAALALLVLCVGIGIDELYSYAALHSWLGHGSYIKFEEQQSGAGGVLLGGRSELFASTAAIADSPWIGHGSWAKDPKYTWILIKRMREFGYYRARLDPETQEAAQNGNIPAHSHILQAWVESGILGGLFWGYVLYLLVRFLVTLKGDEPLLPFAVFQVMLLLWDIFFSPYGAERRFSVTFFLAFLMAIMYHKERQAARLIGRRTLQFAGAALVETS